MTSRVKKIFNWDNIWEVGSEVGGGWMTLNMREDENIIVLSTPLWAEYKDTT